MEFGSNFILIKIGGACITNKQQFETINEPVLKWLSHLVNTLSPKMGIILVHGAGSFGHFQASQHNVKEEKKGVTLVRQSVTKLANIISDSLISNGNDVALCSPFCSWEIKNHEAVCHNLAQIQELLVRGFIPILHGDVVFNSLTKFSILSGDTITKILAEKLKPKRVIYLSNVDGIFTYPPEQSNAEIIRDIALNPDGTIAFPQTNCCTHDVTGGIMFKLTEAIDIVKNGIDVFFARAGSDSAIDACLGINHLSYPIS